MSPFRRRPSEESNTPDLTPVPGERGIPSINRERSLQSRISSVLAVGLMSILGIGLLTWYYSHALTRQARAQQATQSQSRARAQGDAPLPPLGPVSPPKLAETDTPVVDKVLGPAPPPAEPAPPASVITTLAPAKVAPYATQQKTPGQLAFERRLDGPVFAKQSQQGGSTHALDSNTSLQSPANPDFLPPAAPPDRPSLSRPTSGDLASLLQPSATPAVRPTLLPTRRLLLPKGAFIDCTLETAIDSTLPGMTTCVTATDTYSTDGSVVLLERGTKLVGETRGQIAQGSARIFVLWTEARTPTGVVVPLASPGTDELGRSGLPGQVDRHFWDRFGAAILISLINGAVQAGVQSTSHNNGNAVILNPGATTDVMTEVLRNTVDIAPTVTKQQGDRIQVLVARDVDFRSVYDLRVAATSTQGEHP